MTIPGEEFDVVVRGHRLHAQRFGSPSEPLVLGLHGLAGNMTTFDVVGELLGANVLQLVALDLRGRGRSDTTPAGTYGWENHALDVLAVADVLGSEHFSLIGQSMGGSVAMKVAELEPSRLDAVVLVDIAGRVDPGVGPVIASLIERLDDEYPSVEDYLEAVKAQGLHDPWSDRWERCFRYGLQEVDGSVRSRANREAVAEDRRYTSTQDPYARWRHLTMPTLLLRATRELAPGSGLVVPVDDGDRFLREVASGAVAEIAANHLTIATDRRAATVTAEFLVALSAGV